LKRQRIFFESEKKKKRQRIEMRGKKRYKDKNVTPFGPFYKKQFEEKKN
jgi:hypothetical protein